MIVRVLSIWFLFIFFLSPFSVFGKAIKIEDVALAKLKNLGMQLGVDYKTGEIRTLGVYRMKSDTFGQSVSTPLLRERGHKIACLEARKQILQYLKIKMSGNREYNFHSSYDGSGDYDVRSVLQSFSQRILTGWRVEISAEAYESEDYVVAVVVSWSSANEKQFLDLKKGRLRPAENWKSELLTYIKSQDLSSWVDVRVYVDSDGYPHLLGIGIADWDMNVLVRSVALKKAEMFAEKNLIHGLYGDSIAHEIALNLWNENISSKDEKSCLKVYSTMLDTQYHGVKPKGVNSIYTGKVKGLNKDLIVSIYSYEPPLQSDFIETDKELQSEDTLKKSNHANHPKIFNPHTGKFE